MILYLIRHADALPAAEAGVTTDEDRLLSDKGIRQVEVLSDGLNRVQIRFNKIACSPLLRTRQTAERLLNGLQMSSTDLVICEPLAPGGSSKKLAEFVQGLKADSLALVGHEPDLGEHAAWLIGSKKARIAFVKGAIACIAIDEQVIKGGGELNWLITPAWLTAQ